MKSNITIAPKSKTFNFVTNNKQSKRYSNTIMVRWLTNDFIYLFGSLGQLSNWGIVSVWIEMNVAFSVSRFPFFFFFFSCVWTVTSHGFTVHHCLRTVHALKNIKNGSHGTIHTFKNYFTTVLSAFSFSNNKFNPNGSIILTIG